jgi:hypothetical protein
MLISRNGILSLEILTDMDKGKMKLAATFIRWPLQTYGM